MRRAAWIVGVALVGGAVGALLTKAWHFGETTEECTIRRMIGQPGVMFTPVRTACEAATGQKDDWEPVTRK